MLIRLREIGGNQVTTSVAGREKIHKDCHSSCVTKNIAKADPFKILVLIATSEIEQQISIPNLVREGR